MGRGGALRRWPLFVILASLLFSFPARGDDERDRPETGSLDELTRLELECSERMEELRAKMEASRLELEREKEEELEAEKIKLEQLSTSLASCEDGASTLKVRLQNHVRELEQQLKKERSRVSGSSKQLEDALSELEELREAWLPFWFAERFEAARTSAAPKVRQLASAVERQSNNAIHFWRHTASPRVEKMKKKGWAEVGELSARALSEAGKAYRRVPSKYRKPIDSALSGLKRAWPPTRRALIIGHAHLVKAVDEIALLVEQSPLAPSFAKDGSHIVAILVVSLPLTLFVPAMARRRSQRTKRRSGR